ncbi:MAG: DoxX family protein [Candidatus Paceibacterota bacterium]
MQCIEQYAPFVARVLVGGYFLWAGIQKIFGFEGTTAFVEALGLPLPMALAAIALLIEVGAGLALIIGFKVKWAALSLAAFVLVVNLIVHTNFSEGMQLTIFLKNIAIFGGLLYMAAYGAGRIAVDTNGAPHAI